MHDTFNFHSSSDPVQEEWGTLMFFMTKPGSGVALLELIRFLV